MSRAAGDSSVILRAVAAALLACLCLTGFASAQDRPETREAEDLRALSEWLFQAGLDELLAAVLEDELRRAPAGSDSIVHLSEAYIRLLAKAADERRINDLRARSQVLISRGAPAASARLATALARADYRMALRDIERLRKGVPDDSLRSQASAALARAVTGLKTLGAAADAREAEFLRCWCRYWALWLARTSGGAADANPDPGRAEGSALIAGWAGLLGMETGRPDPKEISADLRNEEYYASSILGMALTKALIEGADQAEEWFGPLREKGVWPGISSQLPDWELQALVDAKEYGRASAFIGGAPGGLSSDDASGAACRAVLESKGAPEAIAIAQAAAAAAAASRDLAAVKRLAGRIPGLKEGESFTARLARGIIAYDEGRRPGEAARSRAALQAAAGELAAAGAAAPPGDPRIAAAVQEWLGWARMGAGDYCGASQAFVDASAKMEGDRAEEMSWMAVRAALQGNCPGADGAGRGRAIALARGYLNRFSKGAHSGDAETILARAPEAEMDAGLADRLLGANLDADAPAGTREAAAILAYRRYKAASGQDRADEAVKLLSLPAAAPGDWPKGGIDLVLRLQIEAALDPGIARYEDARLRLKRIEAVYPPGQEPPKLRTETASRRLVLSIAAGEAESARRALAVIRGSDETGAVRPAAEKMFVSGIEPLILGEKVPPQDLEEVAAALIEARRFILSEASKSGDQARAEAAEIDLGTTLLAAERALRAWDQKGRPGSPVRKNLAGMAAEALTIGRRWAGPRPSDIRILSLVADAAADAGEHRIAVEALSRLVNGLPARSEGWFARKGDLCEELALVDPGEARKVLEQHVLLVPDWGPGEAGARLKALAGRLGVKTAGREEDVP